MSKIFHYISTTLFFSLLATASFANNPEMEINVNSEQSPVIVTIRDQGSSNYCQDGTSRGGILQQLTIEPTGEYHITQVPPNTYFCISLDEANLSAPDSFYGPYLATEECTFELGELRNGAGMLHHILLPAKACLIDSVQDTPASYIKLNMEDRTYIRIPSVIAYERGQSADCQTHLGEKIVITNVDKKLTDKNNGFYFAVPSDKDFCLKIDSQGDGTYFVGPFRSTDIKKTALAKDECVISLFPTIDFDNPIYNTTQNCKLSPSENIFMTFQNIGTKNYEIGLYEEGESDDEQDGSNCTVNPEARGEKMTDFVLTTGETKPEVYVSMNNADLKFCVTVKNGQKRGYFGPYPKDSDCQLQITDTENMTDPVSCSS